MLVLYYLLKGQLDQKNYYAQNQYYKIDSLKILIQINLYLER